MPGNISDYGLSNDIEYGDWYALKIYLSLFYGVSYSILLWLLQRTRVFAA